MYGNTSDNIVIIIADITPPIETHIIDFLKSNPKKAAMALPVHNPVVGSGIPTKAINPISSYFSIFFEPFWTFLSIKFVICLSSFTVLIQLNILLNNKYIIGAGIRLPIRQTINTTAGLSP
ncbi:MAG: hypothetical protein PWQ10_677 [Patescibacteria group bacterium]|nr:hypothetical protein [Patescibacteria group bacterium]